MLLLLQDAGEMTEINSLVEIALAQYDADKIGIPDYALESAGKAFVVIIVFVIFVSIFVISTVGIKSLQDRFVANCENSRKRLRFRHVSVIFCSLFGGFTKR